MHAEKSYIELASKYNFKTIECTTEDEIRTIEDISEDVYEYVKEQLDK